MKQNFLFHENIYVSKKEDILQKRKVHLKMSNYNNYDFATPIPAVCF